MHRAVAGVGAGLLCLGLAAPAAAHQTSVKDGTEPSKCKAASCPDILSATATHTATKLTFEVRTKRSFKTTGARPPRVLVKAGPVRYLLGPKGGTSTKGAKFAVTVVRKNAKTIRYVVNAASLGKPKTFLWLTHVKAVDKPPVDIAPNKGFVTHKAGKTTAPPTGATTSLKATGARTASFTDAGSCSSHTISGDGDARDWGATFSTLGPDGKLWILELHLARGRYTGPGTYSIPGHAPGGNQPSLGGDHWARLTDGMGTSWTTQDSPVAVAGTITIGADQRRGTLDAAATNRNDGTAVQLSGPFVCEDFTTS